MIIGVDTSFLLHLFAQPGEAGVPLDANGEPVTLPKERVEGLVEELTKTGATIIVPTPALSEIMVRAGVQPGQSWIAIMRRSKVFKIVPFDEKSAIEVAIMAGHIAKGEGAARGDGTYAKLKYDRQIIAIAHTEGATMFYTDDHRQKTLAERCGMTVLSLADCPVPATAAQLSLPLAAPGFGVDQDNDPEAG